MRALLAEDDPVSVRLIKASIEPSNFLVETAGSAEDALDLAKVYDFDIAIVDLKLPDSDGNELVRRMRAAGISVPVLICTAHDDKQEMVRSLICGADDYITKPFDKNELTARLQAIVRRSKGHAESVIRTGRMTIDLSARTVYIDGKLLPVSPKEYSILELLSLRKGRTLTKDMFLDHLYGGMDEPEQKIVDVFICKLRKKITKLTGDESGIQTVWGHGYMLKDAAPGLHEDAAEPFFASAEDELEAARTPEMERHHLSEVDALLLELLG